MRDGPNPGLGLAHNVNAESSLLTADCFEPIPVSFCLRHGVIQSHRARGQIQRLNQHHNSCVLCPGSLARFLAPHVTPCHARSVSRQNRVLELGIIESAAATRFRAQGRASVSAKFMDPISQTSWWAHTSAHIKSDGRYHSPSTYRPQIFPHSLFLTEVWLQ